MTDNLDRLMTELEAAAYLWLDARHLARLRRSGRIPAIRVSPRRYLYSEDLLKAFLAAQTRPPAEAQAVEPDDDPLGWVIDFRKQPPQRRRANKPKLR